MAFCATKSMLENMKKKKYSVGAYSEENGCSSNRERDPWQKIYEDCKNGVRLAKDFICRVCAQNGCTPLTEKLGCYDYDIKTAICSISDVTINCDDSLPKFVCTECLESLKVAMQFKKTCEVSDRKFKAILNPLGDPLLHSYPYSKHDFKLILQKIKEKRMMEEEKRENERKKREKMQQKRNPQLKLKQFKCSSCDLVFPNKEKLASHRRERQCMRRACEVCGQLVLSVAAHMRQSHKQSTPHRCPTCGKQFPVVARLKNHMLVHTNTFNFFCDLCPYKCKHKYYLVMHMRTHTGEKPYKCSQCPATFVNPSNLNKHKLTHQEKQFKCVLCEKAFRTTSALREHHEATHMNIKHTCNYCGRDFCYKSDLRKHEIRSHNRTKRDYVGGEPSYKQVERMQKVQEEGEDLKWHHQEPQPTSQPATIVQATYIDQATHLQPIYFSDVTTIIQPQTQAMVPQQAVQLSLPDLSMKKDEAVKTFETYVYTHKPDLSMKKDEEVKTYETQQVIGYF